MLPESDAPIDASVAEDIALLERLSRLRKEHFPNEPSRRPVLILGLLFVSAIVVTVLVFVRLPSIPVEFEIDATATSFRITRPIQLTSLSRLNLLQATAFAATELEEPVDLRVLSLVAPMELRPASSGSLALSSISIPDGARVTIQKSADEGTWRLGLEHPEAAIAVTLGGPVGISAGSGPVGISAGRLSATQIDFGRGVRLELRATDAEPARLEIDVTPVDAKSFLAGRLVNIDEISFQQLVEEPAAPGVGIRRAQASSVVGGSLFNQSLGGRETRLRKRATVDVSVIEGHISELRLEPAALHIAASARVRNLKVGMPEALSTLRPSWLEWLAHHHGLKLVWGSAAWLLALLVGGVRWWRKLDID